MIINGRGEILIPNTKIQITKEVFSFQIQFLYHQPLQKSIIPQKKQTTNKEVDTRYGSGKNK